MNLNEYEKKEMSAKDLYIWSRGEDDYGIEVLSAINKIIDGLKELGECGEWQDIAERVDWYSSSCRIAENCDKIYSKDELFDMVDNFETVRKLIYGDKIDYSQLLEMLKNNVDECGLTKEKRQEANKKRKEQRAEQPSKASSEYGSLSTRMPERLKKQWDELKGQRDKLAENAQKTTQEN